MLRRRVLGVFMATLLALVPATSAQASVVVKATQSRTFKPQTERVHKGTKVVWKNVATFDHTVTATSSNWSKNVRLSPGEKTSFTFKHVGTYKYKCRIHPGMTGKVVVHG